LNELLEVDGQVGPWTLLDGYIREYSAKYDQRIFTFLRGLLIDPAHTEQLVAEFYAIQHPGSHVIPQAQEDYYTYGGEIPWSNRFGSPMRNTDDSTKRDVRYAFEYWPSKKQMGVPVEIPVWEYTWEGSHSQLNQVGVTRVPAPALCQSLQLLNRRGEWDLYDSSGNVATLYREARIDDKSFYANILYMRSDLLQKYLSDTGQIIVWLLWGERGFEDSHFAMVEQLSADYQAYANIHKQAFHLI
jgi:hypothetical protein